jgi:CBS domain-containing protein
MKYKRAKQEVNRMDKKTVRDIMVPLDEYPVVSEDASILDALKALKEAQKKLPEGRQPHRAVLVIDKNKKVIGKIGQLAFLRSLEPKYNMLGDLKALSRVGLSSEFIASMMDQFQFFSESLTNLIPHAGQIKVMDVMHTVTEHIDVNASIREAIHQIVILQTLSILVTRDGEVVGLIRLSDLFDEISRVMLAGNYGPVKGAD